MCPEVAAGRWCPLVIALHLGLPRNKVIDAHYMCYHHIPNEEVFFADEIAISLAVPSHGACPHVITGRWCPLVIATQIGLPFNDVLHEHFMTYHSFLDVSALTAALDVPILDGDLCSQGVTGRCCPLNIALQLGLPNNELLCEHFIRCHYVPPEQVFSTNVALPPTIPHRENASLGSPANHSYTHTDAEQQHPADPNAFFRMDQSGSNGAEGGQPPQLADVNISPRIQQLESEEMMTTAPQATPTADDPLSFLDRVSGICRFKGCGRGFDPRRQDNLTRHGRKHLAENLRPPKIPCPHENCDKEFVNKQGMSRHCDEVHGSLSTPNPDEPEAQSRSARTNRVAVVGPRVLCPVAGCRKDYQSKNAYYYRHIEESHPEYVLPED
ncbi:hypothetical protein PtB15_5B658 [Puccinia triticina]|nr:hypothetical protein PtB15_5B658 [Puccinia triticina]